MDLPGQTLIVDDYYEMEYETVKVLLNLNSYLVYLMSAAEETCSNIITHVNPVEKVHKTLKVDSKSLKPILPTTTRIVKGAAHTTVAVVPSSTIIRTSATTAPTRAASATTAAAFVR